MSRCSHNNIIAQTQHTRRASRHLVLAPRRGRISNSGRSHPAPHPRSGEGCQWYSRSERDLAIRSDSSTKMATGFIDKDAVLAAANLCAVWAPLKCLFSGRLLRAGCGQAPMSTWPPRDCRHRSTFQPFSKASDLLGRPVDLVDLDEPTPLLVISSEAGNLFVSSDLANKLRLGLAELATVREQFASLVFSACHV